MNFIFPLEAYEEANSLNAPLIDPRLIPQGHVQHWQNNRYEVVLQKGVAYTFQEVHTISSDIIYTYQVPKHKKTMEDEVIVEETVEEAPVDNSVAEEAPEA